MITDMDDDDRGHECKSRTIWRRSVGGGEERRELRDEEDQNTLKKKAAVSCRI
jgi:hypothetical protein